MSDAKFTKGPWRITKRPGEAFTVESENTGFGVCSTVLGHEVDEFNAHLIAAAPEMYKLLIQLQAEGGLSVARHRQIQRLLTKARGEE